MITLVQPKRKYYVSIHDKQAIFKDDVTQIQHKNYIPFSQLLVFQLEDFQENRYPYTQKVMELSCVNNFACNCACNSRWISFVRSFVHYSNNAKNRRPNFTLQEWVLSLVTEFYIFRVYFFFNRTIIDEALFFNRARITCTWIELVYRTTIRH